MGGGAKPVDVSAAYIELDYNPILPVDVSAGYVELDYNTFTPVDVSASYIELDYNPILPVDVSAGYVELDYNVAAGGMDINAQEKLIFHTRNPRWWRIGASTWRYT